MFEVWFTQKSNVRTIVFAKSREDAIQQYAIKNNVQPSAYIQARKVKD